MSDLQPRKRKDKRRKRDRFKEETGEGSTEAHKSTSTPKKDDDYNIHVHQDAHTGGGWCAKIVFICIFLSLNILMALVYLEYRGSTDLDSPVQESRYAEVFQGWIDDTPQLHDEEEEHHMVDDHDPDDHEEDEEELETLPLDEEEEHDDTEIEEHTDDDDDDDDDGDGKDEDEIESYIENDENSVNEENSIEELKEEEEDDAEDADEEETFVNSIENLDEVQEDDEDDIILRKDVNQIISKLSSDEVLEEVTESDEDNEDDIVDSELEMLSREEEEAAEDEASTSGVAVKIGVGVALIVVAHFVLVRKWNNASAASESTPENIPSDRRNTISVSEETVKSLQEAMEKARSEAREPSDEEETEEVEDEEEEEIEEEEDEPELKFTQPKEVQEEPKSKLLSVFESPAQIIRRSPMLRATTPPGFDFENDDEDKPADEEEDEEEVDEEEEEAEIEDDDEKLLQKLEAKYGKLPSKQIEVTETVEDAEEEEEEEEEDDEVFPSWRRVKSVPEKIAETESTPTKSTGAKGGPQSYTEDELMDDEQYFKHDSSDNNLEYAVKYYRSEVFNLSSSPRALYGLALALDRLAEKQRSNQLLEEAIKAYENFMLYAVGSPERLLKKAANRCINRMRFKGNYGQAVTIHKLLIDKFPDDVDNRNQLAVTYLMSDRSGAAKLILLDTLKKWPNNGFAKVHYGFILKTSDNNMELSAKYLKEGIESREKGVIDGRFFFHLGDALIRLGKTEEAMKVFDDGVKEGFFLSKYQRSLYNVKRLTAQPWWTKERTSYTDFFNTLEINWRRIRDEGLALLNTKNLFKDEAENLRDIGDWKQFELFMRGRKIIKNCARAPYTCSLIDSFEPASKCRRGQTKFSVMLPGTHVWPHCGPTNCRLRAHLGLKIPANTSIRVASTIRSWKEGKILIFDDSFEHEVWHNGTSVRLILIVDVWHPELSAKEKMSLPAI